MVTKMNKQIDLPHRKDDYVCMWNGVEDIYISQTGQTLPPKFFFVLASFGSICYMKINKAELKRMIAIGDGRTEKMYEFLGPIVGFDYKFKSYKNFESALKKAKSEIDAGYPCMLGALDMFYLPYYEKMYNKEHIPFHYELMTGYDDENEYIFINDCGRSETQLLSYSNLKSAWNCSYPGLSRPNTICTIRMNEVKDKYEIAKEALAKRSEQFLNPPVGFVGYKGMEKFIKELPGWKNELSSEDYDKILFNMVQFFGTVPTIPNALLGISKPDDMQFYGGFDKVTVVLDWLGKEYNDQKMKNAAEIFSGGSAVIEEIKNIIVDYLTKKSDRTNGMPTLFTTVKDIMIHGFEKLDVYHPLNN